MSANSPTMPRPREVLCVDDDPTELFLIGEYLKKFDVIVRIESDADEALRLIATEWWDVILVDQRMPTITGLQLIKTARPRNRNAQFYILTGFPDSYTLLEASKGHCWLIWKDRMQEQFEILFDRKPNG